MARCEDCLHYNVCLNIESQHLRIILAGDKAERCKRFMPTADVAPKSNYEDLKKEHLNLIKGYAEMQKDYAREIFEEIERFIPQFEVGYFSYDSLADGISKLKKKYTEGET